MNRIFTRSLTVSDPVATHIKHCSFYVSGRDQAKAIWVIKRKTAKKRMQRAMNALANWCRQNRHASLKEQHQMLCRKLMGHYQYYGITGNFQMLCRVHRHAERVWRFWLDRRSSKNAMPWDKYLKILNTFPLLRPRIVQPI